MNAPSKPATVPNALDIGSLTALRQQVRSNDPKAIKAAAQQFEALFLQQMLKAMRDATPQDGMFDSDQTRMYQSLLDQQLAQVMATRANGTGLAALIEKQLTRQAVEPRALPDGLPLRPAATPVPLQRPQTPVPLSDAGATAAPGPDSFARRIWADAQDAGRALGVPARFIAAQAALESGWGKAEPRFADGRPSYNLFGIKADASWTGPVVEATTGEYVNGVARQRTERFRAYGSYGEAFRDYAALIANHPRYAAVLGSQSGGEFARGLQRAGYATDPQYAAKLERIIAGSRLPADPLA